MSKTSEPAFGLALMEVLASQPNGEATVKTIVKHIPDCVALSEEDRIPSGTRPNEEMWEQRIRNLKSHDKTPGNVIAEGFVEHIGKGKYRLTEAGRSHLVHKNLS